MRILGDYEGWLDPLILQVAASPYATGLLQVQSEFSCDDVAYVLGALECQDRVAEVQSADQQARAKRGTG